MVSWYYIKVSVYQLGCYVLVSSLIVCLMKVT